jgi:hypothetical protein
MQDESPRHGLRSSKRGACEILIKSDLILLRRPRAKECCQWLAVHNIITEHRDWLKLLKKSREVYASIGCGRRFEAMRRS